MFGDNLAAITLLNAGASTDIHMNILIQRVYTLLRKTHKPFKFIWLRRTNARIGLADQLGRKTPFSITKVTAALIKQKFNCDFFIPEVFRNVDNIPTRLPARIYNDIRLDHRTPMVLIPYPMEKSTAFKTLEVIKQLNAPIIFGFPKFSLRFFHEVCSDRPYLGIPKITSKHFSSQEIGKQPRGNCPYIFTIIE